MKKTAVIFDLDGVLCEEFPVPVKPDGKPNFSVMNSLYEMAFPIEQNCELARKCAAAGLMVVVVTARGKTTEGICAKWLDRNRVPFDCLVTRGTDKEMPAEEFKALVVDYMMSFRIVKEILFAVDDSPEVCSMYASRGINTFRRVREY